MWSRQQHHHQQQLYQQQQGYKKYQIMIVLKYDTKIQEYKITKGQEFYITIVQETKSNKRVIE